MSVKKKYLNEEDLKKFDDFIQDSLYKYFYVKPWERLYTNTGKVHHDIISDKSTIPDLVIYNKSFNKNDCFFYSNKNSKYIKFPRVQFLLRPKKVNNYNPSCTYGEDERKKEKEDENIKPFEFKSIPKEIEDKFINNGKKEKENTENNLLFDELNDFMKSGNDNDTETKVKIVQEYEKKEIVKKDMKENEKEKNNKESPKENNKQKMKISNKDNYHKNKFETPFNIINMNNINMNLNLNSRINANNNFNIYMAMRQKMLQNIQYQNYIKKKLENNYLINNNNNQGNKFNPSPKDNKKEAINKNDSNDKNKDEQKNKNINAISYFKNTNSNEIVEFEKYINNLDEIFKNNINNRGWKIVDNRSNNPVNIFNNQELFYFLIL
jgi:hypothetical protein